MYLWDFQNSPYYLFLVLYNYEHKRYFIPIFLNVKSLICSLIDDLLWRMFCVSLKRRSILLWLDERFQTCPLWFIWSKVWFMLNDSLLIFCPLMLSVAGSGIWKFSLFYVTLSSLDICFISLDYLAYDACLLAILLSYWWSEPF